MHNNLLLFTRDSFMKILLCAATGHNPVNILPLESDQINPDLIYVAITSSMQQQGDNLIAELKAIGKKVEPLKIEHEQSLQSLIQQYESWLLQHQDDEIIVNLTGGTKPMSIAAYQLFSGYGFRCFYQNLNPNQLVWLDDETIISDIGAKISLERYLKSYQFDVIKKQKLNELDQYYKKYASLLYDELCKPGRYQQTCQLISKINAYAAKPKLKDLKDFSLNYEEEAFLTHLSHETDLLKLKANTIAWETEQDRAFIAGGWIEYLTASMLTGENYRDISLSVEISKSTQRAKAKTFQEIDVMAMQQQQLFIVECKTVNWKNATHASESIYKLSALGDIGGLNTKAVFVSLYDLPDAAKTRAAEHNIHVIAGQSAILQLKQRLLSI